MTLYKYHGAGNDFLLYDARGGEPVISKEWVRALCDRHTGLGADGLMAVAAGGRHDFRMIYFNPDGSDGMMCGNGGRCIAAFAHFLGIEGSGRISPLSRSVDTYGQTISGNPGPDSPLSVASYIFEAPDGIHTAELFENDIVRLGMRKVTDYEILDGSSVFVDTGARHLVKFVADLAEYDVENEGRRLRHNLKFAPQGVNVNFVEKVDGHLNIRTFEKGVEGETLACGTGIVASAIADYLLHRASESADTVHMREEVGLHAAISELKVEFMPRNIAEGLNAMQFDDILLTGPVKFVAKIDTVI